MATLDLQDVLTEDQMATQIANFWVQWNTLRQNTLNQWDETRRYIFATDTTKTTNNKLPWKNKTTIPKLCQIRDNLNANYLASLFPKRKWLFWEGADMKSEIGSEDPDKHEGPLKKDVITEYMGWVIDQPQFKTECSKLVLDYLDTGNCFSTVDWIDERATLEDGTTKEGYVGPMIRRISPLDIVFNPVALSFTETPKIIRSLVTVGEARAQVEAMTTMEEREFVDELFGYLMNLRAETRNQTVTDNVNKDAYLRVDGFGSFQDYLKSDYVELLTFYGDMYDVYNNKFYKNHKIVVIDRHKVLCCKPNPSYFGYPPIFHAGWRIRQDNLWAMGPLDNVVGLQYRIDHLENLKADVFDLVAFPVLKIKGYVEDFEWGPMERIHTGDDGDVELLHPDVQAANFDNQIALLEQQMEEKVGAPKEAMGFRNPGEKTMYEVQRIENAYTRIFMSKISQFEEQIVERSLNAMLELSRRKMETNMIRVFNNEFKVAVFKKLTVQDITGSGRIRPLAARHFAERAELLQNLTNFSQSTIGQDPMVNMHISGVKTAEMIEMVLDLEDYKIVQPFVRIAEMKEMESMKGAAAEQVDTESQTPAGTTQEDIG